MEDNRTPWQKRKDKPFTPEKYKPISETYPPEHIRNLYEELGANSFIDELLESPTDDGMIDIITALKKIDARIFFREELFSQFNKQNGEPQDSGRAFKLVDGKRQFYFIEVNPFQSKYSQLLALGHEIAHVFIWELIRRKESLHGLEKDDIELFCDYFGDMFVLRIDENTLTFTDQ